MNLTAKFGGKIYNRYTGKWGVNKAEAETVVRHLRNDARAKSKVVRARIVKNPLGGYTVFTRTEGKATTTRRKVATHRRKRI